MRRRNAYGRVRGSGRFVVSDCRPGLIQDEMAFATLEVFRIRYQAFCAQFGRDPAPDEPLFFDPSQARPVPPEPDVIHAQVIDAAAAARVDARLVLDFMRISRRPMAPDPGAGSKSWRKVAAPDRERPVWIHGLPEEPST